VSDGSRTATGWIAIRVVRDDDDDHHDGSAGIAEYSTDPNVALIHIDWNGTAGSDFTSLPVNQADWLSEFLSIQRPDARTLAEITGLVVRME